ncbi:MAG TPA: siderophore-interacting protein [Pseudonocardiaceae bacterium]|nr:siderophore-interacting protein [Pseudonocardiaceae bacterium]
MSGQNASAAVSRRRAPRHAPKLWRVPVLRTEPVTPRLVRVTIGGAVLADFPGGGGDQHVVLYFYPAGAAIPEPLTLESARLAFAAVRPAMRSYTVRRHDPERHEIDIDFVLHGEDGPAARWAARASVGDELIVVGPSPAYQPDPMIGRHLFVGDETALPAIDALLRELPASTTADVLIEVADAAEEQSLSAVADVRISWLRRDGALAGEPGRLLAAVRALDLPSGGIAVWAAGERSVMHELRRHLLDERGLSRAALRSTVYWRAGHAGPT